MNIGKELPSIYIHISKIRYINFLQFFRSLGGFRTISECKEQATKLDWKPLEDEERKNSVEPSDKFFKENTANVRFN